MILLRLEDGMDGSVVQKMLSDLSAPQADARERAADDITDVHRGMSLEQVNETVAILVAAAVREGSAPSAQEAQLHALAELQTWHEFDEGLLRPLRALRGQLPSGYADYLDDLLSQQE